MLHALLPNPTSPAVKAEQIRLLYQQGAPTQLLGMLTVLLCAWGFRDVADRTLLAIWTIAQIVIYLIRLVATVRFSKGIFSAPEELQKWGTAYCAGTLLSGLGWASLCLFFDAGWAPAYQVLLFIIYTGVIAGAFNTNTSYFVAFPAFFLPITLSLIYTALRENDAGYAQLVYFILIYIVLMYVSALKLHKRLTHSFELRFENEQLAAKLMLSNRDLANLADKDELTGLSNRRAMNRYLSSEWKRHYRAGKPLSLLYCDLDFFKQYNDNYGHAGGDQCLVRLADLLHQHTHRSNDMAARFGGEEFALILPETPSDDAMNIAVTLLGDLEKLRIPHKASKIAPHVTMSIGVATMIPDQPDNVQPFRLSADLALYHAKNTGRNRACSEHADCRQPLAA